MCLQCKVKSKLKIFNNVGGKKKRTFIRMSETDGFISKICSDIYPTFHYSPEDSFVLVKRLCFTLSCCQRRGWPQGACPRWGLFPQGTVATGVILVADKSTPHLPPWCQVLSRQTAPRHGGAGDPPRQSGQHVFHAVTGVLIAKLVLEGDGRES